MINILFVFADIFKKGGTEAVMFNIFNNINKSSFHIDFLILSNKEDNTEETNYLKKNGAKIFYITSRGDDYLKHKRELRLFFENNHYDIVHTHMDAIGAEVLKEALRSGVRVRIAHSHNTNQLPNPKGIKEYLHKVVIMCEKIMTRKLANGYVACSTEAAKWLFGRNVVKQKNYLLFRNAIDVKKYVYSEEVRNEMRKRLGVVGKHVIGHVGRFDYQKNHEFLIEIFREYLKKDEKAILLLVGDGENKKYLESIIEAENLSKNVQFLGARDDINRLLQAMDVFVFPSRYEGLGVALIEAQLSGLPCLASSTIPREVEVSDNIRFLNIDDSPTVWSDTIYNVVNKKDNVRNSPLKMVRSRGYDMTECITGLEQFYDQLYRKKLINR